MSRTIEVVTLDGRRVATSYRDEHGHFVFASDIGLPPGVWPERIVVFADAFDDPTMRVETFALGAIERDRDGDVTSAFYASALGGSTLEVWND